MTILVNFLDMQKNLEMHMIAFENVCLPFHNFLFYFRKMREAPNCVAANSVISVASNFMGAFWDFEGHALNFYSQGFLAQHFLLAMHMSAFTLQLSGKKNSKIISGETDVEHFIKRWFYMKYNLFFNCLNKNRNLGWDEVR